MSFLVKSQNPVPSPIIIIEHECTHWNETSNPNFREFEADFLENGSEREFPLTPAPDSLLTMASHGAMQERERERSIKASENLFEPHNLPTKPSNASLQNFLDFVLNSFGSLWIF